MLEGTNAEGVDKDGYVLGGTLDEDPNVVLILTGSELQLSVADQKTLADKGITATVASMPCVGWFESQPAEYRDGVPPPAVSARAAVEAAVAQSWYKLVGETGDRLDRALRRIGRRQDVVLRVRLRARGCGGCRGASTGQLVSKSLERQQ